ncbi:LAME_0D03686g1_1 [Lachancea meyersii CBS 8951]|uniref:Carnitine O-acetyltransferase, mitochondrial n=1 Tax=Lachancea meyersii CBS 8951 TaxID=1266667 RepID=A0A1G4J7Q3_9SACH|nr:LAME_0D03686g1_1 [Lachancea meyersii CBS 8951]
MKETLRITRRMMSSLQRFPFETRNGEFYWAQHPNAFYQQKRKGFQGVTFENQHKMPSLPVPELEETLRKYIETVRPYCRTKEQLEEQKKLCSEFAETKGSQLQSRLKEYAESSRNWLSQFWDNQAYLEYNDPVIPYVSYFYVHKPLTNSHNKIQTDPLIKSTAIIMAVIRFLEAVKDEALPADVAKDHPFCMNSFHMMFNNSRIPGEGRDSNVFYSLHEQNFITVALRGNFYTLQTHNENGEPLGPSAIWQQLYDIVNVRSASIQESTNSGIGTLTSLPRNEWFQSYKQLQSDMVSQQSLEAIQKSLFIVCLDLDTSPVTLEEKARYAWHGNGVNRFFDKPLQFFVAKNGVSAFLAEHSKMDGTPTLLLNDFVCRHIQNMDADKFIDQINQEPSSHAFENSHLPFLVTPAIRNQIQVAHSKFLAVTTEHDLKVWHYNKYGKATIKTLGFSPDAFIQQIIQLGVYKYLRQQLPTYEAASTRRFFKGRTETGRSVSVQSAKFVADWEDPDVTDQEKLASLRASAAAHSSYLKAASAGLGVDRHFFGLKNMLRSGEPIPELFENSLFKYSSTWLISTSQLSSEYFEGYGWSQVNDNGFGLAYMLNKDWLNINIVNKPAASGLSASRLHYYLSQAADEMHALLTKEQNSRSKL